MMKDIHKIGKLAISTILSVCIVFTMTPIAALAVTTEVNAAETATEYAICRAQTTISGKEVLTVYDTALEADRTFIGQKNTYVIAKKAKDGDYWTRVSEEGLNIQWKTDEKYIEFMEKPVEEQTGEIATQAVTQPGSLEILAKMKKETPEGKPAYISAVISKDETDGASNTTDAAAQNGVSPGASQSTMTLYYYTDICDGYNPTFEPYDSDEAAKVISDAINDKRVVDINVGETKEAEIDDNDGLTVFKFKPEKSRYYTFETLGNSDTCGYLMEYDDEFIGGDNGEPSEVYDCIASAERYSAGEGNFIISGGQDVVEGQYEYPLNTYESVTYFIIAKFYRSSETGKISLKCSQETSSGIYDAVLKYYTSEGSGQTKYETDLNFMSMQDDGVYYEEQMLPYNCDWDSPVTVEYLDSQEKAKTAFNLKIGRNVIASSGDKTYVLQLIGEKPEDTLFDVSLCRYSPGKQDVEWEGDMLSERNFNDENAASLTVPRKSQGMTYTLGIEARGSSLIKKNTEEAEGDSIVELDFAFSGEMTEVPFWVMTADGKNSKKFTVAVSEDMSLAVEDVSIKYGQGDRIYSELLEREDFAEGKKISIYVPSWYKANETSEFLADITLSGDEQFDTSDFSPEDVKAAVESAVKSGKAVDYTFSVKDKTHPQQYYKDYTISFNPSTGTSAALKKMKLTWIDSDTSDIMGEQIYVAGGSGTKSKPYTAAAIMPEGVSITDLKTEPEVVVWAKGGANIFTSDGELCSDGSSMIFGLNNARKSDTVKFYIESSDGKSKEYYTVEVYDYNKALAKNTAIKLNGITYKVTATGKSAAVSYVKADLAEAADIRELTIPATVEIGAVKYKVTSIGAGAFKKANGIKTINVETAELTKKGVKKSLTGSSIKTIKCTGKAATTSVVKKYKKYFTKANCGKKVTVEK